MFFLLCSDLACSLICHVLFCHALFCHAMFSYVFVMLCSVVLCSVQFCHVRRRGGGRDNRGHSGQLGVWRPRYAGWEWPGGLSLKSNDPSLSGGESLFVYDVFCMSSSSARDGSMSAPRWTTMAPGAPKMALRLARDVPRWPQSAFLQPQDGAQTHLVGF